MAGVQLPGLYFRENHVAESLLTPEELLKEFATKMNFTSGATRLGRVYHVLPLGLQQGFPLNSTAVLHSATMFLVKIRLNWVFIHFPVVWYHRLCTMTTYSLFSLPEPELSIVRSILCFPNLILRQRRTDVW